MVSPAYVVLVESKGGAWGRHYSGSLLSVVTVVGDNFSHLWSSLAAGLVDFVSLVCSQLCVEGETGPRVLYDTNTYTNR